MEFYERVLSRLLTEENIVYIILASTDGQKISECGDQGVLDQQDIISQTFSDSESIIGLNEYLQANIFPRFLRQGNYSLCLTKPREDLVLGLLEKVPEEAGFSERNAKYQRIHEALVKELAETRA